MKLQIWHVASSAATLMAARDAEIRIPFGDGSPAHTPTIATPLRTSVCGI